VLRQQAKHCNVRVLYFTSQQKHTAEPMRHRAGNVGGGGGANDYMYGSSASGSLGYAGGLGGYDGGHGGPFKDKPKRKGSFVIPGFVQSAWTGFVAALLFAALALHYRSQSSGIMGALQVATVKQGRELVDKLKNEKQEADRGMQRAKSAEKQALVRIQALEKQQRVLEQERDNFRKLAAAGPGSGSAAVSAGAGGIAAAVGSIISPEVAKKREADLVTFLHRLQNFTQQASKDAVLATYVPAQVVGVVRTARRRKAGSALSL
jgi:hypothetical protein